MNVKLRNFLLKSIPYLLSIVGGLTIFIVSSDEIHNSNLNDLINNISASLLSIPLVFLLYDYSNYLISRRVNRTLAAGVMFKVNAAMSGLQMTVRKITGMRQDVSWGEFERRVASRRVSFSHVKMSATDVAAFAACRDQFDDIVYRTVANSTLSHPQIQVLTQLGRELSHIVSQYQMRGGRAGYAKHIENIMDLMGDWYDAIGANPPATAAMVGNMAAT